MRRSTVLSLLLQLVFPGLFLGFILYLANAVPDNDKRTSLFQDMVYRHKVLLYWQLVNKDPRHNINRVLVLYNSFSS